MLVYEKYKTIRFGFKERNQSYILNSNETFYRLGENILAIISVTSEYNLCMVQLEQETITELLDALKTYEETTAAEYLEIKRHLTSYPYVV
jgi:hypothetical protein